MRERFPGGKIEHSRGRGHEAPKFIAHLVRLSTSRADHNNDPGVPGLGEDRGDGGRPSASGQSERTTRGQFGERPGDSLILG
jgi:hypothetical protein